MTITFTAEMSAVTAYSVDCTCGEATGPSFGTYQEAIAFLTPLVVDESLRFALDGCVDPEFCLLYRLSIQMIEADSAPQVNVSNFNASDIFRALGILTDDPAAEARSFEFEETALAPSDENSPFAGGSLAPQDFLGRVLLALAITPADEGRQAIVTTAAGGSTSVLCSRRVGYLQGRLSELHAVAVFAADRGRDVTWG